MAASRSPVIPPPVLPRTAPVAAPTKARPAPVKPRQTQPAPPPPAPEPPADKAGFDPSKEVVFWRAETPINEKIKAVVSVTSYDGGRYAISVLKAGIRANGYPWYSNNIGRLSAEAAADIGNLLLQAAAELAKIDQ